MKLGNLNFVPVQDRLDLIAESVKQKVDNLSGVLVAEIDPNLADTAAFCEQYDIGLDISANCVVLEAKRADKTWRATCLILANMRADVNGVVRKQLEARKVSFASMDTAVSLTGMEYGGITPVGLPSDWKILIDSAVAKLDQVVIGSGIRESKLLVSGKLLESLPSAQVLNITKS